MYLNEIDPNYLIENTQFECKVKLDEKNPLSWVKTVGGFANSKGGIIYLGVEDKTNKLIGFTKEEIDKEKNLFYNQIKQHMANIPTILSNVIPYKINGSERYLLKFVIKESEIKPIIIKFNEMPMIFKRRDGYTNAATIEEISQMSLSFKSPSFDEQVTDITYRREDFSDFFNFYSIRNNGNYPTDKELGSIGFFNNDMKLKRGAYLFSDNYKGEETKVVCSLYRGITRGDDYIISSNSYSGNLIRVYNFINEYIQARMNHGFIKMSDRRVDVDSYPNRALFEAIINSLAHRDYFLSNSQISVDLFQNRISISSPGSLFNTGDLDMTFDLHALLSSRRNELISKIFVFSKAMEAKGTGFEKIEDDYKNADSYHKPYIFSKNNQFTIILPDLTNENGVMVDSDRIIIVNKIENSSRFDSSILSYCYSIKRTAKEISEYVHASNSTFFRNILQNLVNQKYLDVSKEGNTSVYLSNQDIVKLK